MSDGREGWRYGLHGPYALVFTTGGTPSVPDFSWMSGLNLQGWVSSRGKVVLNGLNGMDTSYPYTIGFANSTAQYWTTASSSGSAVKHDLIPGTYVMTVYKGELAVYTENVTVTGGQTTTLNTRTITFNLSSNQAAASHILNIGITSAYNNGRPSVTINGHALSNPGASAQPKSRSFTIGTYRGNNATFSWTIPASYFVEGKNTITITPISGSSDLGSWLSAGWVYDCVELTQ